MSNFTIDQLKVKVPSAFATAASVRMSEKTYKHHELAASPSSAMLIAS